MQRRNQLAPQGFAAKLKNFAANFAWSLLWLLWSIKRRGKSGKIG